MKFTREESNADAVVLALIAGAGIGFGLGLLFAPQAGRKTRKAIARRADEHLDYLKQQAGDLRDSASDLLDKGQRAAQTHKDNIADAVESVKKAYRQVAT